MTTPSMGSDRAQTVRQAWEWVLRLRDREVDRDALATWMRWYESDQRNKDAFDEASTIWQQTSRVAEVPDPLPRSAWRGDRPHRARAPWRNATLVSLAAALIAALGTVLATALLRDAPGEAPEAAPLALAPSASPATLPVREAQLPDGSRVELAAGSSVTMQFTDQVRQLTMQSGVAHFTVAHNRARPFVVRVGRVHVRAVGTAFNIRHASDRVVVTVIEGTVDVYERPDDGARADRPIRVDAGREITWAAKAAGPTIASVDPSRALAWRDGRLDYLNEPLASAVADINRYSQRRIIVRDAAVGGILFSGTVLIHETDEWLRALPRLFPVDVQTDARGDVVLTARASEHSGQLPE